MALVLEVVGPHAASMGANARRVLGESEFKIGREADNDWVLPQNYVSRRQAVIRCVNGMYFIEQVGSCPVMINEVTRPLEKNRIVRLSPGDRLYIDDIEIRVVDGEGIAAPPVAPPPGMPASPAAMPSSLDSMFPGHHAMPGPAGAVVDPLALLGGGAPVATPAPAARPPASMLDDAFAIQPRVAPPPPASPPARPALPDDWMSPRAAATPAPTPAAVPRRPAAGPGATQPIAVPRPAAFAPPSPVSQPAPPAAAPRSASAPGPGSGTLEDLLRGAGVDLGAEPVSPEVAAQLGEVIRLVVEGTMQVLQARNEIRREFRLATTQLARKDNNPLKFSVDAADALHKLLVQRNAAYLDTVSSFADAFDDIRVHQLAMLESLRDAYDHMLKQFDPDVLTEQFARAAPSAGRLSLGGRPKPWDSYVLRYGELAEDRDFAFRKLFGEEFGKAYERHLERHRRMLRANPGTER